MNKKRKFDDQESYPSRNSDFDQPSNHDDQSDRYFRLKRMKKWRLIVRNLPFSCTQDDIQSSFSPFGIIEEIVLPKSKKYPSSNAGFAFIQFRKQEQADEAMKNVNEKEIQGRQVAVDWAVPKDQFMTAVLEEKDHDGNQAKKVLSKMDQGKVSKIREEKQVKNGSKRNSEKVKKMEQKKTIEPTTSDSSDEADEANEEEESMGSKSKKRKLEGKKPKVQSGRDEGVEEGRTIFIRNIPFDVEESQLEKVFTTFGPLKYCVICKYPGTDHSKGSGFVQFMTKEAASNCLEKGIYESGDGLKVGGQELTVCSAVSKESAHQMDKDKHDKQPKDKRNLHLLRVGLIRAGTADAAGISELDLKIRMRIESANREKIKNFNIFVSPTRLCIHNLPSRVDNYELKLICLQAVDDRNAWIKEARVMRDLNRLNSQGVGKSRGFGFVEFAQHEHAMKCLENLNNNPDIFGSEKRPIIEFSLENRKALLAKEQRAEKARLKAAEMKKEQESAVSAEDSNKKKTAIGKKSRGKYSRKRKFVPPTVAPGPGIKIESGTKRKAFPSHFGPKIRHRKRTGVKEDGKKKAKKNVVVKEGREKKDMKVGGKRKKIDNDGGKVKKIKISSAGQKEKRKKTTKDTDSKRARWFQK